MHQRHILASPVVGALTATAKWARWTVIEGKSVDWEGSSAFLLTLYELSDLLAHPFRQTQRRYLHSAIPISTTTSLDASVIRKMVCRSSENTHSPL